MSEPLLIIRNLKVNFYTYAGVVKALDGIDLELRKGETLGLVGETGCGKSVTSLAIMRLVPDPPGRIDEGEILLRGKDLLKLSENEMREVRGNIITMVFQDPTTFLNPVMTMGEQVAETLLIHRDLRKDLLNERVKQFSDQLEKADPSSKEAETLKTKLKGLRSMDPTKFRASRRDLKQVAMRRTIELLRTVRLPEPEAVVTKYPHELSGGMRQRVIIAMAIACRPELLIADEPTTALDVTIQAQILDLLNDLKQTVGLTSMFITHDLGVVAECCDRVAVMYAGNIVEVAYTDRLFQKPLHPYTEAMLRAIPKVAGRRAELESIRGSVPNLIEPPSGCRFHPRCPFVMDVCKKLKPELVEVEPGHEVACFLHVKEAP
ncbi:MAG: ABC transporter ATP-binding protein [Candidatus Bathyarchaeia archaeon]